MTVGISSYLANKWLDALCNAVPFSVDAAYIQLHTAEPGANGTTAVASETTRKSGSFTAASGGSLSNDADVVWNLINGSQDATHFSLWDASSGGNFLGSGSITADAYINGDSYTIPAGSLTLSLVGALAS